MGFMAGFGEGFSKSFTQQREINATKERDAFQVAYDGYVRNKSKYDEDKRADEKAIESAKTLAGSVPGLPAGSWEHAYKWLKAGFSAEDVEKKLRTTKFAEIETPEAPDTALGASENVTPNPLDAQMQESGLAPLPIQDELDPTVEPRVQERDNNDPGQLGQGGLFGAGGLFGKGPNLMGDGVADAQSRLQSTLGVSQEEFDQVNAGFKPAELSNSVSIVDDPNGIQNVEATMQKHFGSTDNVTPSSIKAAAIKAQLMKASGTEEGLAYYEEWEQLREMLDEQALLEAAENGPDAQKRVMDYMSVLNDTNTSMTKVREQTGGAIATAGLGHTLVEMVEQDPEILTMVQAGASGLTDLAREGDTFFNSLGMDNPITQNEALKHLQDKVAALGASGIFDPESVKRFQLFNAALIRFAYAKGKAMGMEGNAMSNKDFQNIMDSIKAGNGKEAFMENIRAMTNEATSAADTSTELLRNSAGIKTTDTAAKMVNETLKGGQYQVYSPMEDLVPVGDLLRASGDDAIADWLAGDAVGGGDTTTEDEPVAETLTEIPPEVKDKGVAVTLTGPIAERLGVPNGTRATKYIWNGEEIYEW